MGITEKKITILRGRIYLFGELFFLRRSNKVVGVHIGGGIVKHVTVELAEYIGNGPGKEAQLCLQHHWCGFRLRRAN